MVLNDFRMCFLRNYYNYTDVFDKMYICDEQNVPLFLNVHSSVSGATPGVSGGLGPFFPNKNFSKISQAVGSVWQIPGFSKVLPHPSLQGVANGINGCKFFSGQKVLVIPGFAFWVI